MSGLHFNGQCLPSNIYNGANGKVPKFDTTASGVTVNFNLWNKKPQHLDTYVVNFNTIVKEGPSISLHANVLQQITSPIQ